MRSLIFAKRNFKEMLRDPLCYIFCIALPIVLMLVLHFAFGSDAPWFAFNLLTPGINCFSYAFVMLYLALLVSQDRSTSFLTRLYTSPMRPFDFIAGYLLPGIAIAFMQAVVCYITAIVANLIQYGELLSIPGALLSIVSSIPVMLIYASIGIIFGSLFSNKAAPGVCSAIITLSVFLSGAWMPIDESGALGVVCRILPFYPSVKVGRFAFCGDEIFVNQRFNEVTNTLEQITEKLSFATCWSNLLIALAYMVVLVPLAIIIFSKKTHSDNS